MKPRVIKTITLLASLLFVTASHAMNLAGQWSGNLEVGQQAVPIIFNVSNSDNSYTATMDSPMQGATGIPVESVEINGDSIIFSIKVAGARYEANVKDGKMIGTWKQSGQAFALNMQKGTTETVKKN
ncbi:hypothetical protein [Alteromonas facilis]|uniref:hypothetical protein n=1 Tax=Alteromonas facilis TaxID=2048004 RepID=UPI000C28E4AB|nr:hypothetical protein [Alteromonas facilis]